MNIYDLNKKSYEFLGLLIIDVSSPLILYALNSIENIVPQDPFSFLFRFRRVKFDGSIAKKSETTEVAVSEDYLILIRKDGSVYLFNKNTRDVLRFDNCLSESLIPADFPSEDMGPYNSSICITLEDFFSYMDSFKSSRPKPQKMKSRNSISRLDLLEDLLEEEQNEEEIFGLSDY